MCSSDLFLGLLALLFPPLPVWVKCGICSSDSLLNLLLCMLGYVPGLLHAWYIVAKYPEPVDQHGGYDTEGARVVYVRVDQEGEAAGGHGGRRAQQQQPQGGRQPKSQPGRQAHMSYGSAAGSSSSAPPPLSSQPHDYNGGEGSSEDLPPPPSYAEVVGDHKIQDRS